MELEKFNRATKIREEQCTINMHLKELYKYAEPIYSNMFLVKFHTASDIEVEVPLSDEIKTEMAALSVEKLQHRFTDLKKEFESL